MWYIGHYYNVLVSIRCVLDNRSLVHKKEAWSAQKQNKTKKKGKDMKVWHTIGGWCLGIGKALGIVALVSCVVTIIVIPIAQARQNAAVRNNPYTIVGFDVERNVVEMENKDGYCEIHPVAISLLPDMDYSQYIGTQVYMEYDSTLPSLCEDGVKQAHIIAVSGHVLQLDLMIDGVVEYTGIHCQSSRYTQYRDTDFFGVYPEA